MHPVLAEIVQKHYAAEKARDPNQGRRTTVLRALHKNWPPAPPPTDAQDIELGDIDEDLFDYLVEDDAPGILIRTDYSNDEAWAAFHAKLLSSEQDILTSLLPPAAEGEAGPSISTSTSTSSGPPQDVDMIPAETAEGEESDDESDDSPPTSIISIINPELPEERRLFQKISNIAALQMINDVNLRSAPPRPQGTKKVQPPHPLIDLNDWQEIYTGKTIWIYDAKSVADESVRLVSSAGDVYGTATGDSWRARVSHIPELQFNMTYLGMQVNFGGLDRWDFPERERNLRESTNL
ncbi:hypothetical protein FA13DRAFT_1786635 [Coprinellus micaceus]|uniref:Uncharacterized protein n=1 Tax=Coprinellus micaceus TaxID=71717 RepID=A0A4Y7TTL1_COPMI|nr:hypothetical protein FA13DRAFT_1786635 [Coprinellus micaceus]